MALRPPSSSWLKSPGEDPAPRCCLSWDPTPPGFTLYLSLHCFSKTFWLEWNIWTMRASRIWRAAPSLGRQANPILFPISTGSCKDTRARSASLVGGRVAKCKIGANSKLQTPIENFQEARDILQLPISTSSCKATRARSASLVDGRVAKWSNF